MSNEVGTTKSVDKNITENTRGNTSIKTIESNTDSKKSQPKKPRKKTVKAIDFIRAYQMSVSHKEVAKMLDMTATNVGIRANGYRKKGINLKEMPRQESNRINVEEANKLIAELSK